MEQTRANKNVLPDGFWTPEPFSTNSSELIKPWKCKVNEFYEVYVVLPGCDTCPDPSLTSSKSSELIHTRMINQRKYMHMKWLQTLWMVA